MKKTIRILIFAIVIQAVSGFGTIGLSNDTFIKYGEKVLIKFKQLEQAEELLVLAPLPENAVAENVNIIKSNFFEDSEFILPDGTKPVGDCDLVEYNGERYIKIKSYSDPDFITALKLKYTGHSEIIGWIDEITNPELLSKLDKLPTAAYTNLENDITSASAKVLKEAFNSEPELVEAWKVLQVNPNSFIKTDVARLEIFHKLSSENQQLIRQFTDVDANSTLAKFLDDCDADPDFLNFINNSDNVLEVKGFLAHKEGMLTADENRLIAEMLENSDEIPSSNVRKWLEYGDNMVVFKANREAGNTFGNLMKTQLGDVTSEAYQALKQKVPNLDEYSIYSQVQLCLKGDCISKGNYWIPDFILIAERTGPGGKYLETIIVDSKLSRGTGWTPNQNAADKLSSWAVKSGGASNLVKGELIDLSTLPELSRNGSFIKLFEENGVLKTTFK